MLLLKFVLFHSFWQTPMEKDIMHVHSGIMEKK